MTLHVQPHVSQWAATLADSHVQFWPSTKPAPSQFRSRDATVFFAAMVLVSTVETHRSMALMLYRF